MDDLDADVLRTLTLNPSAPAGAIEKLPATPYTLLEKLGEGGMGVVYRAHDSRLHRDIALKFLNERTTKNPEGRERFWNEARAAAALDHPNICTVYDIGEFQNEPYISMAYIAGQSLKRKLAAGALPFEEAVELATQIALGLQAAHLAGIVHRDVKPSNLLLTNGGVIKIVDFGLALLNSSDKPVGDSSGTPAYMSPEQAHGLSLDARSDLWSLGVTMYQMASGTLPFRGEDISTIRRAMLRDVGVPAPAKPTEAFQLLEPIIRRALTHDREDRYPTAAAMIADLKSVASVRVSVGSRNALPGVAVMPFANLGGAQDTVYFSDGLTEELINALAHVDGLRVVSRSSVFEFKDKPYQVRDVGARLSVGKVLEGSVRMSGGRVRVTAQLTNVDDGFQVWSERFDRQMADVFEIQDEITHAIVEKLKVRLSSEEERRMNATCPKDMEAYDLYLKGKFHFNLQTEEGFRLAIEHFTRSTQVDPGFAPVHAGLADAYSFLGFHGFTPSRAAFPMARAAAARALEINPSLPDANISMGYVKLYHDWNWPEAERYLRLAVEINPGYAKAYYALMLCLVQTGRFEEGRAALDRALELDPFSLLYHASAGWLEYYAKRPRVAIQKLERAMDLNPDYPEFHAALGAASEQLGSYADAVYHLETAVEAYGQHPLVVALLGVAHASGGNRKLALETLDLLDRVSAKRFVPHVCRALIHAACQDRDNAFAELTLAAEDRDAFLCWMNVYPGSESIRSDPRFGELLHRVRLA